ncbi:MAG: SprB repeat-containing protein, partial [Bacteroidota bacterium]
MLKRILTCICFLLVSIHSFATHIVGGELNYVYNGGSSYTIKLKLYKDCGSGAAAFPGNVTISVRGYNGVTFASSKDITMNLGTVNNIPSSLSPCAIPPNPMPCVQEGIYTITVNNLPPNPGGYHLYYQVTARNLSLTNINGACNCIGESFYAYIPGTGSNVIWNEDFSLPNNTIVDNAATAWSIQNGSTPPSTAFVNNSNFEITGSNNASFVWTSQNINISSCGTIALSTDLSENGNLDNNDSISVYYRLNGGPLTLFATNGFKADDFNNAVASVNGLSGSTVQVIIRVKYDGNSPTSEVYKFDNIVVTCTGNNFLVNNNATFNLFPPLFLCVNQPFNFNHSATDSNGDSLIYSLYTPYNGDGGTGPLDPTFSSNIASFTPVNYLAGFSTYNPLGVGPFSINSSTGLITGTPGLTGQFVVGVMVKEYRNGVYLSQTLRDFQFNVLNCPQPPPTLAVANTTVNNGCSAKLTAAGISSTSATWTSVFPGAPGAYNSFLSCTSGCLSNTITSAPTGTPPPYVDYVICGTSTSCAGNFICDTFRVTFNSALAVDILPSNPVLCSGQTSTTITAVGSGGTPPYSYLWNNTNPVQTINIGAGNFTIKLTDASGCPPVYNSVTVTAYTLPIAANAGPDQTKCIQNPLTTLNGTVTGSGGGIWTGGQGTFAPNNITLTNLFYTPSATELAAGSAMLFLTTTGNGVCPSKTDTVIISFQNFTGAISSSITPVSCFSGTNGAASINLSGGVAPHTFIWNTIPTQASSTATNLSSGIYSVQIANGIGCTTQTTVNVTQPTAVNISPTIVNVNCNGSSTGSVTLTASGGTSPYSYMWLPGGQTTPSVSNLAAGIYTANVTDSKGCVKTNTFSVTQPSVIAIGFTQTNVACFGGTTGSISSGITGGTTPYSYSWSNGSTTPGITNLSSGVYTLTVTDAFNCSKSNTVSITQSAALTLTTSVVNESCNYLNNGSATAIPSGGIPGYTYLWAPGGQTTSTITNQTSGTYSITITDSKGCQKNTTAVITEPQGLTVGFNNVINVSCFNGNNGSVTANVTGGTPNYTYTLSPGGSNTAMANNLSAGIYTVAITDSKSCTTSNTISITQPTTITVTNTIAAALCNGSTTGSVSITASGGTSPYSYMWLPGGQTTPSVSNLAAGIYTANVTDSKGCVRSNTFSVTQPSVIAIGFTQTNVACYGGTTGSISSGITGGTTPY